MEWIIYLLSVLDSLCIIVVTIILVTSLGTAVSGIVFLMTNDDEYEVENNKLSKVLFKWFSRTLIVSALISVFVPDSKTVAAMYLIPKIVSNTDVQEMPKKLAKIMNKKLDKWIDSMIEDTKDKVTK